MVQTDIKVDQISGRNLREAIGQLDDRQIFSLIQQLIDERETLLRRQDHLTSLSRLWERTISEADDIAKQVKDEAKQQAESEAQSIVAEARKSAEELLKQRQAEAVVVAQKEIHTVAIELKQDLDAFSVKSVEELQLRLDETAKQAAEAARAYIDALRAQFATFSQELDRRLSTLEASASQTATIETPEPSTAQPAAPPPVQAQPAQTEPAPPGAAVPPTPKVATLSERSSCRSISAWAIRKSTATGSTCRRPNTIGAVTVSSPRGAANSPAAACSACSMSSRMRLHAAT